MCAIVSAACQQVPENPRLHHHRPHREIRSVEVTRACDASGKLYILSTLLTILGLENVQLISFICLALSTETVKYMLSL